jgi:hypothetical protein
MNKTNKYEFRARVFISDPHTIIGLNRALALNGSNDRYVQVDDATPLTPLDENGDAILSHSYEDTKNHTHESNE